MQPKSSAEKTGRKRCAARADQIKKTASSFSYDGICSILDDRTFTLIIKKILNVLYLSQEIISSRRTRQKLWIMNENKKKKTSKSQIMFLIGSVFASVCHRFNKKAFNRLSYVMELHTFSSLILRFEISNSNGVT